MLCFLSNHTLMRYFIHQKSPWVINTHSRKQPVFFNEGGFFLFSMQMNWRKKTIATGYFELEWRRILSIKKKYKRLFVLIFCLVFCTSFVMNNRSSDVQNIEIIAIWFDWQNYASLSCKITCKQFSSTQLVHRTILPHIVSALE